MKPTKFEKHNMKILGEKQGGKSCIFILTWKQVLMSDDYNTSDSNNNDDRWDVVHYCGTKCETCDSKQSDKDCWRHFRS